MTGSPGLIVAVDIGGTFTDLVAYDPATERTLATKSLTTYGDFGRGIFDCLAKLALPVDQARLVKHGTTLVINALIQRRGAVTGLLCTEGFRDTLEIGRGNRPLPFDLAYRRDPPLVPRERRLEVAERMDPAGTVLLDLDEDGIAAAARAFAALGVEAVAVSFLNAYANPAHERRAAELLRRLLPDVYVAAGGDLSREWHEYERTATAAANAYVGPLVGRYLERLETALADAGCDGPLLLMGSSGGMLSVRQAARSPVMLVESGPIGGCIGTAALARALGIRRAIAFDMGGTTAKCAVVEDYGFHVESTYYIGGYERGFPIRAPVLDIVEVGTGGSSIAWTDAQGRLHVGPLSAGSSPGPVCYGRGGTAPTVTDANLLLGRLDAGRFLGGEMTLDTAAAGAAMDALASPLGYSGDAGRQRLADGIVRIAVTRMAGAIRQVTVSRGRDPRDFTLIAYGGGGPLHAVELARELQIPTVVVPPEPGSFSAAGMLLADLRAGRSETFLAPLCDAAVADAAARCTALAGEAVAELVSDTPDQGTGVEWHAELRHVGQHHTLRIAFPPAATADQLRMAFLCAYAAAYGHGLPDAPVEFVGLSVTVTAAVAKPDVAALRSARRQASKSARRAVFSTLAGRPLATAVVDRYDLGAGAVLDGPAVVEDYGSTTVLDRGDRLTVGRFGELAIACVAGG